MAADAPRLRFAWTTTLATVAGIVASSPLPAQEASAPRVEVERAPANGFRPRAELDARGVLHLVQGDTTRPGDLFYLRRAPESNEWSEPLRVNRTPGIVAGFDIAVGAGGRVHVLIRPNPKYLRLRKPGQEKLTFFDLEYMLYTRLADDAASFEPERDLSAHTLGFEGMGTVLVDGRGHVLAFWHGQLERQFDEPGRRIYRVESTDEGRSFGDPEAVECDLVGACQCCAMSGLVASDGSVHLALRGSRKVDAKTFTKDSYALVSSDHGRSFDVQLLDPWLEAGCPGSTCSLVETPDGVYTAWQTRGRIRFGPASDPQAQVDLGTSGIVRSPRLAAGKSGERLVLWSAPDKGLTKGAAHARWRVYDSAGSVIARGEVPRGVAQRWGAAWVVARANGSFLVLYDGEGAGD